MASFSIDVLPSPALNHDTLLQYSARLKALRLRSLKGDTKSFISKYESEVGQPEDFWLARLRNDRAVHLILARDSTESSDLELLQKQWVGFVVIVAPSRGNVKHTGQRSSAEWEMSALYIEPDVRGQGLGKRLVEATIDYIGKHGFKDEGETPVCLTSVRHGNDSALGLYQKLGFFVIEPNEHIEKEGRSYLATQLRFDFQQMP
ncbi:hypothetical protein H2200_006247 [Cladophialophora chaetospira]|uniref:N-acetyltransferase domain-containing protein n=1 Tax=Cladophialophora chaetospira TaxID=386627 RepID=A0AA38XB89_9EURO|nr:hypothetical protein H2200_006247 [Cladophialophora chaetospira]